MILSTTLKRSLLFLSRLAFAAFLGAIGFTSLPVHAETLLQTNARYPRIRLLSSGELIATVLLFPTDYRVKVFSSTNNGASWTAVGIVDGGDNGVEFASKRTSSPDFIVMPNGDLILGLNVDTSKCDTCRSKIKLYRSTDKGRTWSYLSTPVVAPNSQGLWEPNFSIATDGALVMMYSDETSSCCNQKLMRIRSYDGGITWQDRSNLVALGTTDTSDPNWHFRPGMAVVTKLKNGTNLYVMSYDMCGVSPAAQNCRAYYKRSTDGWNYGPITDIGTIMVDGTGRYFGGTPVVKAIPNGPLLWIGHHLVLANGNLSSVNGMKIERSASGDPDGPWTLLDAPVTVTNPEPGLSGGCDNYSPALQWINDTTIVMMSSRSTVTPNTCDIYFGSGPSYQAP